MIGTRGSGRGADRRHRSAPAGDGGAPRRANPQRRGARSRHHLQWGWARRGAPPHWQACACTIPGHANHDRDQARAPGSAPRARRSRSPSASG